MQTWTNVAWKTIQQLEVGELALAKINGARSLILKCTDTCVGILDIPTTYKGVWFPPSAPINCISLGTDWFLDVVIDEDFFPENPIVYDSNAMLFFGPAGFRWKFRSHANAHNEIYVPISGGDTAQFLEQHSAPVLQWSIWESEKHRLADGNRPLMQFSPTGTGQS